MGGPCVSFSRVSVCADVSFDHLTTTDFIPTTTPFDFTSWPDIVFSASHSVQSRNNHFPLSNSLAPVPGCLQPRASDRQRDPVRQIGAGSRTRDTGPLYNDTSRFPFFAKTSKKRYPQGLDSRDRQPPLETMPFRNAYQGQNGSHDFHNQRHAQHLAIVDPDSVDYSGWHEMDFTTAPLNHPSIATTSDIQQAQGPKYAASMDTDIDSMAYLRPGRRQNSTGSSHHHQQQQQPALPSGDLYSTGPFTYSQLLNMDADLTSLDQSSLSSSRTDTDSNMINDGSTMASSLSGADALNTSPPVATLDPISIQLSKNDEKLCPLIAGQVDSCQPQRCGPDAPCMNFTTLPPIEECTSVPCITQSSSPNETMITSESVVSLHQRPGLGSRSTTGRSAGVRRSSTSSGDNQVQSVPLPPRTSNKTAAARRQAGRNNNKKVAAVAATEIRSDDDDDDDQMNPNKPTAPSKADAKQRAKQAHSLVERKYRENLNAKIAQLHTTLQSSHYGPKANEDGDSDAPSAAVPANKVRKSDVLTEAMNYVNQTEVEMRHMENEIQRLGERVRVLEKLVRCEDCSLLKQMVNLQVQAV